MAHFLKKIPVNFPAIMGLRVLQKLWFLGWAVLGARCFIGATSRSNPNDIRSFSFLVPIFKPKLVSLFQLSRISSLKPKRGISFKLKCVSSFKPKHVSLFKPKRNSLFKLNHAVLFPQWIVFVRTIEKERETVMHTSSTQPKISNFKIKKWLCWIFDFCERMLSTLTSSVTRKKIAKCL